MVVVVVLRRYKKVSEKQEMKLKTTSKVSRPFAFRRENK